MNAADVVGYAYDADTYCQDCCPVRDTGDDDSECWPIFASEEVDCPMHCAECGELLPTSWTRECIEYVVRACLTNGDQRRGMGIHNTQATIGEWVDYFLGGLWPRNYMLCDDGSLDTVVSATCSGCGETVEVRFSDTGWARDDSGAMTSEGWSKLVAELDRDEIGCGCDR